VEIVVRDKVGQVISPGSYIVYGHALGRCAALRIGKVLEVRAREKTYASDSGVSIVVRGINDDWGSYVGPRLNERDGTLLYPNRVIVLATGIVPLTYLHLFGDGVV
jgi:hypothetical protein